MTCNLWFVLVAFDGTTLDGRLYLLLKIVDGKSEKDIYYRTRNLFAPLRFIYFFADVPHFTKSTSNFLYYSGSRCCTRHMLNYRKDLFWQHMFQIYQDVLESVSKNLPKLTHDRFHRISFSATIVKHVVRILSTTKSGIIYVWRYLPRSKNPDAKEFDYNDHMNRIQRNVSHTSGNTGERFVRKKNHGTMLQMIKFQKSKGVKCKYLAICLFFYIFIFLSTSRILLLLLCCYILLLWRAE